MLAGSIRKELPTASLSILLLLCACGGGGAPDATPTTVAALAANGAPAQTDTPSSPAPAPAPTPSPSPAPSPAATPAPSPSPAVQADATSPTAQLAGSAMMTALAAGTADSTLTTSTVAASSACAAAYALPAALRSRGSAPLPASGGVFFTEAELATWRARVASGPFVKAGDYASSSPGDWATIAKNAASFGAGLEGIWAPSSNANARMTHGTLLRDAAFYRLVTQDGTLLAPLRTRLLAEAANPLNDFTQQLCLRQLDGSVHDADYPEASWLLRFIVAYDFVRASLADSDRATIDAFVRRDAYFFAAQLDYGLDLLFPDRLSGSYARTARDAAATGEAAWLAARVDTNGDCKVDSQDDATAYPVRNYTRGDGSLGPRTSVLSQWFNNRKAVDAAAIGAAGVLLADSELIVRAKRYQMEWLTYGVWADGSEGEYARNGDYCIPQQGLVYASLNLQSGLMLARLLARQGDTSLFAFGTRDGLFGTASGSGDPAKSLSLVASTRLRQLSGDLAWYRNESWLTTQKPRADTHLGRTDVHYMGDPVGQDDYHELGLLFGAADLPALPISGMVLRDPAVTSRPFPGASGRPVATGFGSWAGSWTDAFNALPALLLLR